MSNFLEMNNIIEGDSDEDDDQGINWREQVNANAECDGHFFSLSPNSKSSPLRNMNGRKHHKCIIHIDFDCFYCQVEVMRNPALKRRPFGVYQKHIVVSSNYVARELGVQKMCTRSEALKVCPDMIMVNGEELTVYREYSMKMFNLLKTFTPLVERVGFDENFIDVTKLIDQRAITSNQLIEGHCYGFEGELNMKLGELLKKEERNVCDCGCYSRLAMASSLASEIRKSLHDSLGLTASAGIAHSKVLAKLVGKIHKPNQQTTILPTFAEEFLFSKKVREIPGIGSRYSKDLNNLGVETVSDLSKLKRDELKNKFGAKKGDFMANISLGIDNTVVNVSEDVLKSISEEESFRKLTDFGEVKKEMKQIIQKLLVRLDKDGRSPRTIRLAIRRRFMQNNYARISRQANFDANILKSGDKEMKMTLILEILIELFDKMIDRNQGFDLAVINVCFTNFNEVCSTTSTISKFFGKNSSSNRDKASNFDLQSLESASALTYEQESNCVSTFPFNKNCKNGMSGIDESMYWKDTVTKSVSGSDKISQVRQGKSTNPEGCLADDNSTSSEIKSGFSHTGPFPIDAWYCKTSAGNSSTERKESLNETECPEGIDQSVFMQLPIEIRSELLQDWRKKEHDVVCVKSNGLAQPKKKPRKDSNSGTKSIRSYFMK